MMKYKKTVTILCSSLLLWTNLVEANKEYIPYVLAQTVNNIPVERETCVRLIREANGQSEQLQEQKVTLEQQLDTVKSQYDEASHNYQEAEQAMQAIQQHLDDYITELFNHFSQVETDFLQLSEEAQTQKIESDPTVQQLKQQYDDAVNMVNEWSAVLQQFTTDYQTLQYQLEQANIQADSESDEEADLNQCRLYPYSVPYFVADPNLVNASSEQLDDYLAMLHQSLQAIIPSTFRKLPYKHIMQAFDPGKHTQEDVQQELAGKQKIVLSDEGKHYYTYAQELNLFDIKILANMALAEYYQTGDMAALQKAYFDVLQMKDGQLAYIYALNAEQFELIQTLLVDYLNNHQLYDEKAIQSVKSFHDLYQVQLVYFNENDQQWHATQQDLATYSRRFYEVDFANGIIVNSSESVDSETSLPDEQLSENDSHASKENLDRIKNKFNQRRKSTTPPSLPNPPKDMKSSKTDKAKDPAKLPSTGEQQTMWWIAGGISGLAIIFVILQIIASIKEKRRRKAIQLEED